MKLDWDKVFWWSMSLFCAFILYQILRRIFGGSWEVEIILLTMISICMGMSIHNAREISSLKGEFKGFKRVLYVLARDFKVFRKEMQGFKEETTGLKHQTQRNFDKLSHLMKEPS